MGYSYTKYMVTIYTQTKKILNYLFRIEKQFNLVRLLAKEYEKDILLAIIGLSFLLEIMCSVFNRLEPFIIVYYYAC